jgi:tungstate transport system permease protein
LDYLVKAFYAALNLIFTFDPEVFFIVYTSLKVSIWAIFIGANLGVPLGLLIALKGFRGKEVVLLLINTLMALPTVVVGIFLYVLLSRRGPLGSLGLLYTPKGIILGEFLLALPIIVNLTISAVQGLDPRLFLTCKSLGASTRQEAWMILKEARFAVIAAIVAAYGRMIGEVGIAMIIGGNIKGFTRTMTTAIALETSKGEFELGLALGMLLLFVALGVNVIFRILQREEA